MPASKCRSILTTAAILLAVTCGGALALTQERLATTNQGAFEIGEVAEPADLNGDGYLDIVIGNYLFDSGGHSDNGIIYIYFGGPTAPSGPSASIVGGANNTALGLDIATLDYNDDGYGDIVARRYAEEDALVFLGGPVFDTTPDITITGGALGGCHSIEAIGDIDGDGDDDLAVADFTNDRIHIYRGGYNADGNSDLAIPSPGAPGRTVGVNMAAGDFDGDGRRDLAVSDYVGFGESFVYVYFGRPASSLELVETLRTFVDDDEFGRRLFSPGDMDNDGDDELIVAATGDFYGSLYYFPGAALGEFGTFQVIDDVGSSYPLTFSRVGDVNHDGRADILLEKTLIFGSDVGFTTFGERLSQGYTFGIGDIDRDGNVEVLSAEYPDGAIYSLYAYKITRPWSRTKWIAGHRATIEWKGTELADIDLSVDGGASWQRLASGVGGDIQNTLAITVPSATTSRGLVRVVYSGFSANRSRSATSETFEILPDLPQPAVSRALDLAIPAPAEDGAFGQVVAVVGDINADGYDDVLVGAPQDDTGGLGAGAAYLYFGGPAMDWTPDVIMTGNSGNAFGASVSGAGDANGDGYLDFLVGATGAAGGDGRAYLFLGGPGVDGVADVTFVPFESSPFEFGASVAALGDVSGDGYDDVGVGNPGGDQGYHIYYGGPGINGQVDDTGPSGGESSTGLGDVNDDGALDYAVGDPSSAVVTIRMGRPPFRSSQNWTLRGPQGSSFGSSIAGHGDLDGDGIEDLAVGAPLDDLGGADAGRVFVYLGRRSFDDTADLVLTGMDAGDRFGSAVAFVSDLNGDGFDELAVGAPFATAGGTASGRIAVFFGGPLLDSVPDLVIDGSAQDRLGTAVAGLSGEPGALASLVIGAPASSGFPSAVEAHGFARYHLTAPGDGTTWTVGAEETIAWTGAERADVFLSVDGGASLVPLLESVGGRPSNSVTVQVPHLPTRYARLLLKPSTPGVSGQVQSRGLFTIEATIALDYFRTASEGRERSSSGEPSRGRRRESAIASTSDECPGRGSGPCSQTVSPPTGCWMPRRTSPSTGSPRSTDCPSPLCSG
ncbi:MAG: VCBS repeat-containing protein [Candidatus Eisenbacteria bacterium]